MVPYPREFAARNKSSRNTLQCHFFTMLLKNGCAEVQNCKSAKVPLAAQLQKCAKKSRRSYFATVTIFWISNRVIKADDEKHTSFLAPKQAKWVFRSSCPSREIARLFVWCLSLPRNSPSRFRKFRGNSSLD